MGVLLSIVYLLLPPKESCNNLVNFESLYGTCNAFFALSPSAEITFPNANYKVKDSDNNIEYN